MAFACTGDETFIILDDIVVCFGIAWGCTCEISTKTYHCSLVKSKYEWQALQKDIQRPLTKTKLARASFETNPSHGHTYQVCTESHQAKSYVS